MKTRLSVLAVLMLAGCAQKIVPPTPPAAIPQRFPEALHWVRGSAEYQAAVRQVYRLAGERLESLARERSAGSWAVILDADETVLDNSEYQKELALAGAAFADESWTAWCRKRAAPPLPGSRAFLERVRNLGGHIAIVTNRREGVCADTAAVFQTHGLPFDAMLCRPDQGPGDKNPRFESVAEGTARPGLPALEVVMWIGDNIQDFPGLDQELRRAEPGAFAGFGVRYFVVPNPMYGSWERTPQE